MVDQIRNTQHTLLRSTQIASRHAHPVLNRHSASERRGPARVRMLHLRCWICIRIRIGVGVGIRVGGVRGVLVRGGRLRARLGDRVRARVLRRAFCPSRLRIKRCLRLSRLCVGVGAGTASWWSYWWRFDHSVIRRFVSIGTGQCKFQKKRIWKEDEEDVWRFEVWSRLLTLAKHQRSAALYPANTTPRKNDQHSQMTKGSCIFLLIMGDFCVRKIYLVESKLRYLPGGGCTRRL